MKVNTKLNLHVDAIQDTLRDKSVCASYISAIAQSSSLFQGKEVLTLFTGHGFLTLLCAKTNAKHIHSICETKQELELERIILEENNLRDKVTLYLGPIEACYFNNQVDIIVSIPFGYCLYFGNRIQSIIYARDNFLKKKGLLFPNQMVLRCSMIQDSYYYDKKILFWEDVYGIDMTPLTKWVMTQPIIDIVDPTVVSTTIQTLKIVDMYKVSSQQLDFMTDYQLKSRQNQINVHGLIIWFDVYFNNGPRQIILSTSPFSSRTKFKQSIFYLQKQIPLSKGDVIKGKIAIKRSDNRTSFKISYHCKDIKLTQFYFLT